MCLTVERISNGQDLIVTGSKDHYIKVNRQHLRIYFSSSHQHWDAGFSRSDSSLYI